jgi:hypothetical protein
MTPRFRYDTYERPVLGGEEMGQMPHDRVILRTYRVGEREEVFETSDAFYLPPGHIPVHNEPGSEFVQFSPTKELRATQAVMRSNMEAMQVR